MNVCGDGANAYEELVTAIPSDVWLFEVSQGTANPRKADLDEADLSRTDLSVRDPHDRSGEHDFGCAIAHAGCTNEAHVCARAARPCHRDGAPFDFTGWSS